MGNNYIKKSILFLLISVALFNFSQAQETIEIYPNLKTQKKMKLCAVYLATVFTEGRPGYDPDGYIATLSEAIDKYGIDMVQQHGFDSNFWLKHKGYEKLESKPDQDFIDRNRSYFKRIKEKGVYFILSAGEPRVPEDLFIKYPEMREVNNGKFWQFMEDKTKEIFDVIPEMDCYEVFTWETPMVNDNKFFSELEFEPAYGFPFYSHSDNFKYLFDAFSRAAHSKNKDLMLLTFSHYPYQEKVLIDALKARDKNYPFFLNHKCQPGDWVPVKPANNIMLEINDMPAQLQFDGTGEYWGQSLVPYCYPEEIQARVQHALTYNQNINTLTMRVNWVYGSLFGNPNEVNFYALSRLAEDPFTPIEQIWKDWAVERFGAKASDRVISALKRTDDIGRRIFYVEGMWVFNHSSFANLPYVEGHIVNYGKTTALLKPEDITGNYRMNELLNYPREYRIQEILDERDEALRLNALSLIDIEAARKDLSTADYSLLKEQLTRQRDMAKASKLHLEALFRYRIEKLNAPEKGIENRRKLEICLQNIQKMAKEMDHVYDDKFPFLKASLLEEYVSQVKDAVSKL